MPSRRVRQHLNPLRADLLTIALEHPTWPAGRAIEVEIGSAEAHFLMDRAADDPGRFYVGLEIRREVITKARAEARRRGVDDRVVSVFANVSVDIPRLFRPGQVARFFVNFPDPWWKSRQQKRRVIDERLVAAMIDSLSPGGEIYVATDIFDLALDALAAMEACEAQLENVRAPWRFLQGPPFAARSRRERQCETEGTKIWRLGYRKRQTGA